jgi:hypothetical protein
MSRLVLISNKQCDGKDLACAGQTLAADAEPGLWLGWNGDVQNFAQRPISCRQGTGYDQVTFPLSIEEFRRHYQGYYHDGLWPVFHNQPEKAHFTPEKLPRLPAAEPPFCRYRLRAPVPRRHRLHRRLSAAALRPGAEGARAAERLRVLLPPAVLVGGAAAAHPGTSPTDRFAAVLRSDRLYHHGRSQRLSQLPGGRVPAGDAARRSDPGQRASVRHRHFPRRHQRQAGLLIYGGAPFRRAVLFRRDLFLPPLLPSPCVISFSGYSD